MSSPGLSKSRLIPGTTTVDAGPANPFQNNANAQEVHDRDEAEALFADIVDHVLAPAGASVACTSGIITEACQTHQDEDDAAAAARQYQHLEDATTSPKQNSGFSSSSHTLTPSACSSLSMSAPVMAAAQHQATVLIGESTVALMRRTYKRMKKKGQLDGIIEETEQDQFVLEDLQERGLKFFEDLSVSAYYVNNKAHMFAAQTVYWRTLHKEICAHQDERGGAVQLEDEKFPQEIKPRLAEAGASVRDARDVTFRVVISADSAILVRGRKKNDYASNFCHNVLRLHHGLQPSKVEICMVICPAQVSDDKHAYATAVDMMKRYFRRAGLCISYKEYEREFFDDARYYLQDKLLAELYNSPYGLPWHYLPEQQEGEDAIIESEEALSEQRSARGQHPHVALAGEHTAVDEKRTQLQETADSTLKNTNRSVDEQALELAFRKMSDGELREETDGAPCYEAGISRTATCHNPFGRIDHDDAEAKEAGSACRGSYGIGNEGASLAIHHCSSSSRTTAAGEQSCGAKVNVEERRVRPPLMFDELRLAVPTTTQCFKHYEKKLQAAGEENTQLEDEKFSEVRAKWQNEPDDRHRAQREASDYVIGQLLLGAETKTPACAAVCEVFETLEKPRLLLQGSRWGQYSCADSDFDSLVTVPDKNCGENLLVALCDRIYGEANRGKKIETNSRTISWVPCTLEEQNFKSIEPPKVFQGRKFSVSYQVIYRPHECKQGIFPETPETHYNYNFNENRYIAAKITEICEAKTISPSIFNRLNFWCKRSMPKQVRQGLHIARFMRLFLNFIHSRGDSDTAHFAATADVNFLAWLATAEPDELRRLNMGRMADKVLNHKDELVKPELEPYVEPFTLFWIQHHLAVDALSAEDWKLGWYRDPPALKKKLEDLGPLDSYKLPAGAGVYGRPSSGGKDFDGVYSWFNGGSCAGGGAQVQNQQSTEQNWWKSNKDKNKKWSRAAWHGEEEGSKQKRQRRGGGGWQCQWGSSW
ncbi:unnamed protein product [Amoebophrya sp. A120]|nr:unnamed protein product [Amoebophrya sp. A120]|eukprot:GSA120T00016698001.1